MYYLIVYVCMLSHFFGTKFTLALKYMVTACDLAAMYSTMFLLLILALQNS